LYLRGVGEARICQRDEIYGMSAAGVLFEAREIVREELGSVNVVTNNIVPFAIAKLLRAIPLT